MRSKYPMINILVLFAVAVLLSLTVGGPQGAAIVPATAAAASPLALPLLEGTWSGAWTDTIFGVSGDMTFVIWSEGADFVATELGNGSVVLTPAKSGSGTLSASASGTGNVGGVMNFGPFTLIGTASDTEIGGSFEFTSPGGGKGTVLMTKTSVSVEPTTWGDLKATYTDR